jgi:mannitol/fructose-specific phosphotransferase system IIA component
MEILSPRTVRLGLAASDKEQAIRLAGQLLVAEGYVAPAYVTGMLAREKLGSNYLGHGLAIPHGRQEDLQFVYQAGISALQLPDGVVWEPGEKAYLVLGLAATSNELSAILVHLVELLRNPQALQRLIHTKDPQVLLAGLDISQ